MFELLIHECLKIHVHLGEIVTFLLTGKSIQVQLTYSNLSGFESYPVPNQVVVSSRTTQQLFN